MRILRWTGYLTLALVLLFGPLYGAGRIMLPDWLKGQMASALPEGSQLSIGEMFSTAKMGVQYKNILFESSDGSLKINFNDLLIEPNLSLSKPARISVGKGFVKSGEIDLLIKEFNGAIILGDMDKPEVSLLGKIQQISDDDKAILSNMEFLIQGLASFKKSVTAHAGEINLNFVAPEGPVSVKVSDLDFTGEMGNDLNVKVLAKKAHADLSALGGGNTNRVFNGEQVSLKLNLREQDTWVLPLEFNAVNLTSPAGKLGASLQIKATGVWKNAVKPCSLSAVMSSEKECGKMTDVLDIDLAFKEETGRLLFLGEGYCVTPNAGCPQRINTQVKTKNTAEILSKVIISGVLNPIVGGVILGALLSSPVSDNSDFDHQASIKAEGNRIFLNGKPII